MTEQSYPRLEDGVVIYEPPASKREPTEPPKPPPRSGRTRRPDSNEADKG